MPDRGKFHMGKIIDRATDMYIRVSPIPFYPNAVLPLSHACNFVSACGERCKVPKEIHRHFVVTLQRIGHSIPLKV